MARGLTKEKYETGPGCTGCAFRNRSQGYCGSIPISNSRYFMLGGTPLYKAIETGRAFAGGPSAVLVRLLSENTDIKFGHTTKSYAVKCRPIAWNTCSHCKGAGCETWTTVGVYEFQCDDGKIPKISSSTGDFVDIAPSSGQVAECAHRYLHQELKDFAGDTILALGAVAIRGVAGKAGDAAQLNGSVYEHDKTTPCEACGSTGIIIRSNKKNTKLLKGRCSPCKGKGYIAGKTDAKVSRHIQPHQLMMATLDPIELMRRKTMMPAVEAVLKRLDGIHDTNAVLEGDYTYFPDSTTAYDWPSEVCIDIETDWGSDPRRDKILLASVSSEPETSVVFKPDDPRFLAALDAGRIVGQNYTLFDAWWLYHHTGKRPKSIFDTRFAGHLLNPDTPNNLTVLSCEYALPPMGGYWKSANNYKHRLETVCALDTDATYRVQRGQVLALRRDRLYDLMEQHVIPLSSVCLDMRIAGMSIDKEKMDATRMEYLDRITEERTLLPYEGTELTRGLNHWLYTQCEIPNTNSRQGDFNTRKETLAQIAQELRLGTMGCVGDRQEVAGHIDRVLSLRRMSKMASGFLSYEFEGPPKVYPILNPAGTATLRLSCSGPNTQQVSKDARDIFIPDGPGRILTSIDISQAEVVTFLWMAEEWKIYEQVLDGADVHSLVATLCGISRDEAKVTTFALLYGEEPDTTAVRLGIPLSTVLDIRTAYFQALPGVARYRNAVLNYCRDYGYVLSPFGVRRYLSIGNEVRGRTVNQAMNTPIQNTPAMVTRIGMVNAASSLPGDARLWMQVHDEILVEHDIADSERVAKVLQESLHAATESSLLLGNPYGTGKAQPLRFNMDIERGPTWGKLVKL